MDNHLYDFDLFTIGGGSGGVRASRMAAEYGARVALAEHQFLGGTCVNVWCIPKKLMSYASHYHDELEMAAQYGWRIGDNKFDWKRLIRNVGNEVSRLNTVYRDLLTSSGVTLIEGHARIEDAHTVVINGKRITARYILVATGSRPVWPDIPGKSLGIVSDHVFHMNELPRRAVIVGGGYIAVEMASILNGLGTTVTLVHRGPTLLQTMDADLGEFLSEEMKKKGIRIRRQTEVLSIKEKQNHVRTVMLSNGDVVDADVVLFSVGRTPVTNDLGLENIGVQLSDRGAIQINENFQSTVPSVFAIGDVVDRITLTPMALEEGMVLSNTLFGDATKRISYANVPTAVFSHPNVATVGLTEYTARRLYKDVVVFTSDFRALKHSLGASRERVFMKLIVEETSDRVLGIHMVGPDAGEIIQGYAVALNMGITKAKLDATIAIHPTIAEEFVTMRIPEKNKQSVVREMESVV